MRSSKTVEKRQQGRERGLITSSSSASRPSDAQKYTAHKERLQRFEIYRVSHTTSASIFSKKAGADIRCRRSYFEEERGGKP
jgi:hypothetical protein